MVWVVIALAVIGLAVVGGGLIATRRSGRSRIEEWAGPKEAETAAVAVRRSPLGDALDRALARSGMAADLATQLARADIRLTVGEFLAATVMAMILGGGVVYFLTRQVLLGVLACVAGFFIPRGYVALVRRRRLRAFNDQLSDTINLMVNSLRAGYSILQAMETIAHEMAPPISTEFGRVVQEVQFGLPMEQALHNMLRRVPSDDLDMMVTALNVQREVGGNLAEVLDTISYTIRERVRIKGEMRALTAYGRGAGVMLSVMPVIIVAIVFVLNREFVSLLFTQRCGWIMIGVAVLGNVLGFLIIRKIVNIDV